MLTYFLLLAVLLAAACLVVIVAAGLGNRLLLAWLFCDFFFLVLVVMPRWPCLGEGDLPLPFPTRVRALPPEWGVALPLPLLGAPERDPAACYVGAATNPGALPKLEAAPTKRDCSAERRQGKFSATSHSMQGS